MSRTRRHGRRGAIATFPAAALATLPAVALAALPALALVTLPGVAPAALAASPPGVAAPAASAAPSPVPAPALAPDTAKADGEAWWAHVRYLADDQLEGRFTGSAGYRKAADYVAARFKEYGLAPAGTDGYMQPVEFEEVKIISMRSGATLVRGGKETPLSLGRDFVLSARGAQPGTFEAPLVFAGYGLHLPDAGYDDLAGLDLRGKVVVYLNSGPAGISEELKAHAHASEQLARELEQAGAVGLISVPNPRAMDRKWESFSAVAAQPTLRLADPALQETQGPFLKATFNPAQADKLFDGSGHRFDDVLALADAHQPLPRFALAVVLRAHLTTTGLRFASDNVAGLLRGADPALGRQVVVVSAHLDHLGFNPALSGHHVFNGAMDNASGVASILEIARRLAAAPAAERPRRSILFLAICGEEEGLLGSRYFAQRPTVPRADLVADLNLDMFLPLFALRSLVVEGLDESSLGDDARAVGAAAGVEVGPDPAPDRAIFVRSDQYSFIRAGVPAIMLMFGAKPGSREAKTAEKWFDTRYHAVSDDVRQPVDLAAAAQFNQLMTQLVRHIAADAQRPAWKDTSYFKHLAPPAVPAPPAAPAPP